MVAVSPFTPNTAGTKVITVAATSAAVTLPFQAVDQQIMISSLAANGIAFVEFGISTVSAAVTTGTPILPGKAYVFTVAPTATHIATIGTVANTLYVTSGAGVAP